MPLVCPRCQRTNPDPAVYCYFDGTDLKSRQAPLQTRQVQVNVQNQGQGVLHGTLTISEGGEWLRLRDGSADGKYNLKVPRQQQVGLQVDTRGLAAGQTYGAKLTLISNGGAVEVPV